MNSNICCADLKIDMKCTEKLQRLYSFYMSHKFDLLGSGFVKLDYTLVPKGFHGKKYITKQMSLYGMIVKKILQNKNNTSYEPINWFIDYKSGFFFNPLKYNTPNKCNSIIGNKTGVDIKCPWELGRFYHLVQMAVLAVAEEKYRESIIVEFKNELIDFWTLNPVGKTVQWSAPMDMSVRMVNLLVAYDILMQLDEWEHLDTGFQRRFDEHIKASLKFVMEHLEYTQGAGSNHYLSNVAGVIFAASYLSADKWTDACMVFGVQELIEQVKKQFYEEGSHFEGSTSYHRLCTEFVLYPTALVYGVLKTERKEAFRKYNSDEIERLRSVRNQKYEVDKKDFFPRWYIDRIYNMGIFTKAVLKGNNEITQVGDNDSGRLIKLTPMGETYKDNGLDHRTLLSAMSGLFSNDIFSLYEKTIGLESSLIRALSSYHTLSGTVYDTALTEYGNEKKFDRGYQYKKETVVYIDTKEGSLLENVKINYYKKFGLLVLKSNRIFLSVVIDTAENAKYTGHTHNDKLSIELMVDRKYITRDPGEYIYTAMPKIRDCFRSVKAHNTIHVKGKEQNVFSGIFEMKKRAKVMLLYCCRNYIVAKAEFAGVEHFREIQIDDNKIIVTDYSNRPFEVYFTNRVYSVGYGEIKRRGICDSQ